MTALLAGGIALAASANAAQFDVGDVKVVIEGNITAGTIIRTETPDPWLVPQANGAAVGVPGLAPGGRGQDDGNLNYRRGDPVSTVLKTLVDLEARYGNAGMFLRGMAWSDFTLTEGGVPWGNIPNGYVAGAALAESSNRPYGRFAGAALLDANVFATFDVADRPLFVRLGNQLVPWGAPLAIPGGLSVLNPVNTPASRRPGALPAETRIPFPAVFARYGLTSTIELEAFHQFVFVKNELDPCGTFFSAADFLADRCDKVFFGAGLNDRQSLAAGNLATRAPDPAVSNGGQFGFGVTYKLEAIGTKVGAYFAQYHSRSTSIGAIRSGRADIPLIPGNPDGKNPQYFVPYPEGIRMYALNAVTRLPGVSFYGEIAYRPNQPLQLNSNDLTNAFVSNTAPTLLRADANATPLGGVFLGYDRYGTTDIQIGANKEVGNLLGADAASVAAELGVKYVHGLPDVTQRRYGRGDVFGLGPVNGVCTPTTPVNCSNDGFVSDQAWNARTRVALSYANVFPQVDLVPSAIYGYDLKGWSYDGVFNQGRQFAILSLRAEYQKRIAAEIAFWPTWGGHYHNTRDRDFVTLSVNAKY